MTETLHQLPLICLGCAAPHVDAVWSKVYLLLPTHCLQHSNSSLFHYCKLLNLLLLLGSSRLKKQDAHRSEL